MALLLRPEESCTETVAYLPSGVCFSPVDCAALIKPDEVTPLKTRGELGPYDPAKSWKDINFTRVPIGPYVRQGENILKICGQKHNNITELGCHLSLDNARGHYPTEAETAYIVGDFLVENIDNRKFLLKKKTSLSDFRNLTWEGCPFYAGKAKYILNIDSPKARTATYKIINPAFADARLFVNGRECAVLYSEPCLFTVRRQEGGNRIELLISTTLFNLRTTPSNFPLCPWGSGESVKQTYQRRNFHTDF